MCLNPNRDMFKFACKEVSDLEEQLSVNRYIEFDFSIEGDIDYQECVLELRQNDFCLGDAKEPLILESSRGIGSFNFYAEIVESSGDSNEDIRIMCEHLAEVVLKVVEKFREIVSV
ncbi:hypothetical protein [uncultured Helicobacter sp.]|uniref:hypothetical protein n=1 Tax=uncultured Helicobacter sp. TaxID=175537 RepID=UPI00261A8B2F|nr:hypothetical protein [uncultured Helicobacter sp.]